MPSDTEVMERLIRDFRANLAELQRHLEPFVSGEQTTGSGQIDGTGEHIAQLKRGIAEYERLITVLERRVGDA